MTDIPFRSPPSRRPAALHSLRIAAAAGVAVFVLGAATRISAADGAKPIVLAAVGAPDLAMNSLKAKYRRPAAIPFPKDNPYTAAKVDLGKRLYFDNRLSAANVLACASCHSPAYAWGDGQPRGIGHGMKPLGRRSPSIVNAAFGDIFMWDGRAASLEEQALGPIKTDVEMNLPIDELLVRLKGLPEYAPLFEAAFPGQGISPDAIAKAIATFERTVVSGRAPFDAWIEGDEKAIPDSAKNGFVLFNTTARCNACHSGWNFTDDSFHDIGLPDEDIGRGKFLPNVPKMQHAFKTPGLREIARRGPYMHNGSIPTLKAVVDHYEWGGVDRPSRSAEMKPLQLTAQDKTDLVSFLNTLTSDMGPTTIPVLPR